MVLTRLSFSIILLILSTVSLAQDVGVRLDRLDSEIQKKLSELEDLRSQVEDIKLAELILDLEQIGLPAGVPVKHKGLILSFNEKTGQAAWVTHIISPDIIQGSVGRTNDFRDDPLVEGEAIESDYFLKDLQLDSTYAYDGFGYDRGHLAPSADFRWSLKALSESYFYSNMSPMHPDFNREAWAEMEGVLRAYVERNKTALYVVTLPVIEENAKRIERGTHRLPIPSEFIKVVMDPQRGKGVAFKMPNKNLEDPLSAFCYSIDDIEAYVSLDFFPNVQGEEELENDFDIQDWFPDSAGQGVEPLLATSLPQGHINTSQAKLWMGSSKKVNVCGTVVSTRFSGSGNYWLNFDKKFPDTVFSVYIRKDDFIHFDKIDINYLINEKVCVEGKVTSMYGIPNMNIEKQEEVKLISP